MCVTYYTGLLYFLVKGIIFNLSACSEDHNRIPVQLSTHAQVTEKHDGPKTVLKVSYSSKCFRRQLRRRTVSDSSNINTYFRFIQTCDFFYACICTPGPSYSKGGQRRYPIDRYLENQFRYPLDREQLGCEGQQINHSRLENPLFVLPDCITNTGYLCHCYFSIYLYVRTRKMKLLPKQDQTQYSSTSLARKTWTMMWYVASFKLS